MYINSQQAVFPWYLHPAQLYALALEQGMSSEQLLTAAGLSAKDIDNSELMISWQQYRAMAELVDQHGPEHWSILLGQQLTVASHGLLSLAVINCNHWDQVLDLLVKFKNLVTALFYIEKHESDEHILLLLRPEFTRDPLMEKYTECFFLAIYQAMIGLSNTENPLNHHARNGSFARQNNPDFRIYFAHDQPGYATQIAQAFDHNIEYNHWCYGLRVHKKYLQQPINTQQSNAVATQNMITMLKGQMQQMPNLTGELHALHQLFQQGMYSLDDCASALHTSATTLKRRLNQACSSFNQELKSYRAEQAHWLLSQSELSQEDISQQLGFQDVGSFRRFFKSLNGQTPLAFRSQGQ